MQALVIQKEILLTKLGLRKPRGCCCSELGTGYYSVRLIIIAAHRGKFSHDGLMRF
jgi:hypothetical protein